MHLKHKVAKLIEEHSLSNLIHEVLELGEWDKTFLAFANHCLGKAHSEQDKTLQERWYQAGRTFHRIRDELLLTTKPFKISGKDVYECKCSRKFQIDLSKDKNCKFDVNAGVFSVTCPSCGIKEIKK